MLVSRGEYYENVNFNGKNVVVASLFIQTGAEEDITLTILTGNGNRRVTTFNHNENSNAQLIGFTCRQGYNQDGGAIFINRANPRIKRCRFTENYASRFGGVAKIDNSCPTFEDCKFTANAAGQYGGVFFVNGGNTRSDRCLFQANNTRNDGGAVKVYTGIYRANYCDFISNIAGNGGGAVRGCDPETETHFDHCTFIDNQAGAGGGGALLFIDRGEHELDFCTLFANTANDATRSAIYSVGNSSTNVDNSIIWGNGNGQGNQNTMSGNITKHYCDVEAPNPVQGDGNFTEDPLFLDVEGNQEEPEPGNSATFNFMAGQNTDVGDVVVYQLDGNNDVYIHVTIIQGWTLEDSHIDWATNINDIPHNNGGPIPGQFEYAWDHCNGVSDYTYRIDVCNDDFTGVFLVHGVVRRQQGGTETAWAGDEEYPGNNWSLYFEYEVGDFAGGGVGENPYDVHLTEDSPAIDAGDPEEDYDPDNTIADIGAYWFEQQDNGGGEEVPPDSTIQDYIDLAEDGDTVWVNPGVYEENIDFGGIYISDASPTIDHCYIHSINNGASGGGVFCSGSESRFTWCRVYSNTAREGGGFSLMNSDIDLRFCLIYDNQAQRGGGVYTENGNAHLTNCTVSRNRARVNQQNGEGGGLYMASQTNLYLLNNIMWADSPEELACAANRQGIVIYVSWNDIQGGLNGIRNRQFCDFTRWTVHNIDSDPLFVDGDEFDFHLDPASPCVDQGDPASDPDPDGTRIDMGALYCVRDNCHTIFFTGGGWWQISISVAPFDNGREAVFWDDLTRSYGVYDFTYDVGFSMVDTVGPGPGYFFGAEDTTIFLDVFGEELTDTVSYPLQVPWNQVGCPFLEEIELADVLFRRGNQTLTGTQAIAEEWISPIMYCWRHEWFEYRTFSTFYPWYGYWLLAMQPDITMLIPPPDRDGGNPAVPPAPPRDEIADAGIGSAWHINIDATAGERALSRIRMGVDRGAGDGFDNRFDYPEPMAPPDGWTVRAYFNRNDWHPEAGDHYARDIRATYEYQQAKEWEFTVEATEGAQVLLNWETMPFTASKDYTFILVDRASNRETNMALQTSYAFQSSGANQFVVRTQSFSAAKHQPELAVPRNYAITDVYPNPFNSTVHLGYDLPVAGAVRLALFDAAGREVAELRQGYQPAGSYSLNWQAGQLPTGVYFLRLETDNVSTSRKIVLMK